MNEYAKLIKLILTILILRGLDYETKYFSPPPEKVKPFAKTFQHSIHVLVNYFLFMPIPADFPRD